VGQNFEELTSLLQDNGLYKGTEQGGTWFWPDPRWQHSEGGRRFGGKRAIWACYSQSLVRAASTQLYSATAAASIVDAVVVLYGGTAAKLWEDYEQLKSTSILFKEECFAGAGRSCTQWRPLDEVLLHVVVPPELLPPGAPPPTLQLRGEDILPQRWSDAEDVVSRIMVDAARHWQRSPMANDVRVVAHPNESQNIHNHEVCLVKASQLGVAPGSLHETMEWIPVQSVVQAYLARQPQAVRADMAATRLLADITRPLSQPIAATTTTLDSECYHGVRLPSIAQAALQQVARPRSRAPKWQTGGGWHPMPTPIGPRRSKTSVRRSQDPEREKRLEKALKGAARKARSAQWLKSGPVLRVQRDLEFAERRDIQREKLLCERAGVGMPNRGFAKVPSRLPPVPGQSIPT